MADAHHMILGKVDRQAVRDLFRTPRRCPPPMLPASVSPTDPHCRETGDGGAIRRDDHPGLVLFHVRPQRRMDGKTGRLRATCGSNGVPLRGSAPIFELAAARRRILSQFA
jgi:hypothetical protein